MGNSKERRLNEIISFSQDTAAKTGRSERSIQQEVQIATNLTDEVKEQIKDTPLADKKTDLLQLARLEPEKQSVV